MCRSGSSRADGPMTPRRVLFVESYPHVLYGQQQTMLSLLDAHDPARLAPIVAMPAAGPFADELRARGIPMRIVPYPSLLAPYGGVYFRYSLGEKVRTAWQVVRYAWRLRSELRALGVEGVFCNDTRGLLTVGVAARTLGLPVMIWEKLGRPQGWLDVLQLPLATVTLVISDAVVPKYPGWQVRLFRSRIVKVFDGVDLEFFARAPDRRAQLGLAEGDTALAIVGTVTERKGHDRVLRVFDRLVAQVPSVKLLVVGEPIGEQDRRYRDRLPNKDHPRVAWLGVRRDIPAIMKSIDLLVVPSRHEGLGRVIVEAMAAGKPVVGARTGGIPEVVIDGETGLLFDGDDAAGLLDCLVRASASRRLRDAMGGAGRRRAAACFDRREQTRQVLDLMLGMLPRSGDAPATSRPRSAHGPS